jgi:hypothetical protein
MTDKEIDDVIDSLLLDIEDPEVRNALARWGKSLLRQFDLSTLTPEELSETLEGLIDVQDVLLDVEEQVQRRLTPKAKAP